MLEARDILQRLEADAEEAAFTAGQNVENALRWMRWASALAPPFDIDRRPVIGIRDLVPELQGVVEAGGGLSGRKQAFGADPGFKRLENWASATIP